VSYKWILGLFGLAQSLGAKVGRFSTFRFVNSLNVPDMLNIGDGYATPRLCTLPESDCLCSLHVERPGEMSECYHNQI
jgi:hypothetical protein